MEEHLTEEEMDMADEDIDNLCLQRADAEFSNACVGPLEKMNRTLPYAKISGLIIHFLNVLLTCLTFLLSCLVDPPYQSTLANLIDLTQGRVENVMKGDVWIVSAMAQRASAQAKINSSIE